jgi:alpha-tubulin suppressor-like RCC1 family protein
MPGAPKFPEQADLATNWASLVMDMNTSCAIDQSGQAWCWGFGQQGQVGDGGGADRQKPAMLAGTGWLSIAPAALFSTGVQAGALVEWGQNYATGTVHSTPFSISGSNTWSSVTAGNNHACGVTGTTAYCWGDAASVGFVSGSDVAAPATALPGTWSLLGAGTSHTCGFATSSSKLQCWGTNPNGQLANGSMNPSVPPANAMCQGTACSGTPSKIVGGATFGCALYTDGHLACWGDNTYGQFGNGNIIASTVVIAATPYTDWQDVAAGDLHACGIRSNGTLWCWGHGDGGQLGNGLIPNASPTPLQVGTDTDWMSVACGDHDTCALKTDHTRWCWGNNQYGSLGDGKAWQPGFAIVANSL